MIYAVTLEISILHMWYQFYRSIAIDRERKTWSGSSFVITQSFFDEINKYMAILLYIGKVQLYHLKSIVL